MTTGFSKELLDRIKDAILAVQYRKQDIIAFLKDSGCTKADLGDVEAFQENSYRRVDIVDRVFGHLCRRADCGVGQFRAMLQQLEQWTDFDGYWFSQGKLDRSQAVMKIENLRLVLEKDRKKREEAGARRRDMEREAAQPRLTLAELRNEFLALYKNEDGTRQQRGFRLQKILVELARLERLEVTEPFTIKGEQIDGAIKYDGEHYLIEAKWEDRLLSNEPLYQMAQKVHGKMYGRGIFISINGYTDDSVWILTQGKAINLVLWDGADLIRILEGYCTFSWVLDQKVKAAQTKGHIYVDAETLQSKSTRRG